MYEMTTDRSVGSRQALTPPASRAPAHTLHGVLQWAARSLRSVEVQPERGSVLVSHLRHAIQEHELTVEYQPQFDLRDGSGLGVEALVRWIPPSAETISPAIFIPLAERSGLIAALGSGVLQLACEAIAQWRDPLELCTTLSVNVSTHQVDAGFCDALERILDSTGFNAQRLELEITESALFSDERTALMCLTRWKRLGVRVALDDFGTGFCSLSYLSKLPIDRIKLDKSFVHSMATDRKNAAIVRSLVALGRELGVTVLAEGVETEAELSMLLAMDCRQAQGFLLAPPVPAERARQLLATRWGRRSISRYQLNGTRNEGRYAS